MKRGWIVVGDRTIANDPEYFRDHEIVYQDDLLPGDDEIQLAMRLGSGMDRMFHASFSYPCFITKHGYIPIVPTKYRLGPFTYRLKI